MANVRDPEAVAAAIGRKKVGKERFQRMAAMGRSRAALARKRGEKPKKTMREGGGGRFAAMVSAIKRG